jgi:lipid A disaccharide synthetase
MCAKGTTEKIACMITAGKQSGNVLGAEIMTAGGRGEGEIRFLGSNSYVVMQFKKLLIM